MVGDNSSPPLFWCRSYGELTPAPSLYTDYTDGVRILLKRGEVRFCLYTEMAVGYRII
jgi:hypothetical protein